MALIAISEICSSSHTNGGFLQILIMYVYCQEEILSMLDIFCTYACIQYQLCSVFPLFYHNDNDAITTWLIMFNWSDTLGLNE